MQLDKLSDWQKCGKLWVIYNYIVELPWINMSNLLCAVFFSRVVQKQTLGYEVGI